jgi:hypothetical protein
MSVTIRNITTELTQAVQKAIKEADTYLTVEQLWKQMPRQMPYHIFLAVLLFLKQNNKLLFDDDGAIIWIYADDDKSRKLLAESTKLR